MESKIVRRVQQVMNILPSFSPYPSSSLPLTTTDTKGSARDNEQKKSKIMVAEGTVVGAAAEFFKDYANGDYTPASGGPLYNAGANYEGMASVDLAGNPRKIGSKIDIGCYEARSSSLVLVIR